MYCYSCASNYVNYLYIVIRSYYRIYKNYRAASDNQAKVTNVLENKRIANENVEMTEL